MIDAGQSVLAAARLWKGTPFAWEASLRGVGCDCRGLLAGAARDAGRPEAEEIEARLTGYARHVDDAVLLAGLDRLFAPVWPAAALPDAVLPPGLLQAGDVLAIRLKGKVQHLAIATGSGGMVHAYLGEPALVCEVPLSGFWQRRIAGVWRWKLQTEPAGCTAPAAAARGDK
jgi:NlpC/P60 family putative phage cell wall peptidase